MADVASPGSPENILQTLLLIAIFLGSILGNSCVVAVIVRSSHLRESPGTFLVFSLALLDGIFIPIGMAYKLKILNFASNSSMACIFFSTYITMLVYVSILHLSLLSLDRYISVVWPLRYEAILTKRRITCLLVVAWCPPILSLMVVSFIIGDDELKFRAGLIKCGTESNASHTSPKMSPLHQVHLFANSIMMGVLPLLAIVILNSKVAFIAYQQAKRIQPLARMTGSERQKKEKRIKEMKWAKTMGIVIGAFVVTIIPAFACVAIESKFGPGTVPPVFVRLLTILTFLNSTLNVIIYSIRSQVYRHEIKRLTRDLKNKILQ